MAAQQTSCAAAVLTVVFTSVVAPVLVHVFTEDQKAQSGMRELNFTAKPHTTAYEPVNSRPHLLVEERVVAQGIGRTAEEAWYDAMAKAISLSTTSLLTPQVRAQYGAFIRQSVLKELGGLVCRCDDLGLINAGSFWRRDVAVFVNRTALMDRLRAIGIPVARESAF